MSNIYIQILKYIFIVIILLFTFLILLCLFSKKFNLYLTTYINRVLKIENINVIFLVVIFILAISYVLLPGYIEGHDFIDRLTRIQAISNEIQRGNFPAFIFTDYNNGYGTGSGLTYIDFFYYLPAILCSVGVPLGISYKVFVVFIVLITLLICYFSVKKMTNSKYTATLISSLYIMSSYYFTDLYLRADLGENLAMAFIPLIVLGLYELIFANENKGYYLTIGLVGLYLSHSLSCYLCAFLVLLIVVFNIKKLIQEKRRLVKLLIYGLLSIGLVAWHWIPMFDHMLNDNMRIASKGIGKSAAINSVNPLCVLLEIFYDNLIIDRWTPPGIGVIFLILFIVFYKDRINNAEKRKFSNQLLIIGVLFLWMSTTLFPFNLLKKIFNMMEFPWRFYMLVTSSLLIGYSFHYENIEHSEALRNKVMLLTVLSILFTYTLFTYNFFIGQPTFTRTYNIKYSIASGYMVPKEVDFQEIEDRGCVITSNNNFIIIIFDKNGTNVDIVYSNNEDNNTYLDLPLIYYKGYKATENGKLLNIEKAPNGIVRIQLNNNKNGEIHVYYDGLTKCRIIGLTITLISVVVLIFLSIKQRKKLIKN